MSHAYDLYGWYTGEVPDGTDRSTPDAPMPADETLQPNWTGHKWILLEYTPPPVQEALVVGADGLTDDERTTLKALLAKVVLV